MISILLVHLYLLFLNFNLGLIDNPKNFKVDADRIQSRIEALSEYGTDDRGGTSRVAFSDADVEGREYFIGLMRKAGLETSIDFAGNLIGRRAGTDPSKKPIAFGSHIDTVPNGGDYDGCVGSIGALEVIEVLNENNYQTDHPLEVIIFADEEGGVVGSRALIGKLSNSAMNEVSHSGLSIAEGIEKIGGDILKIEEVEREYESLTAFLELHIEQGGILDKNGLDIGVVEGIVGIEWWEVIITGTANHAGTTPMHMRQDAMLTAAKLTIAINEAAVKMSGRQVATVGKIQAEPGAPNVIPGKVTLSLEIRDLSEDNIWALFNQIQDEASSLGQENGTSISFRNQDVAIYPALTDKSIQKEIAKASRKLGLAFQHMPSGAGHDAQDMALIAPTGMIFVPSKGGISHAPSEFTSKEDMANGANVLLQTVLALDRKN